jgi:hypothetical protein
MSAARATQDAIWTHIKNLGVRQILDGVLPGAAQGGTDYIETKEILHRICAREANTTGFDNKDAKKTIGDHCRGYRSPQEAAVKLVMAVMLNEAERKKLLHQLPKRTHKDVLKATPTKSVMQWSSRPVALDEGQVTTTGRAAGEATKTQAGPQVTQTHTTETAAEEQATTVNTAGNSKKKIKKTKQPKKTTAKAAVANVSPTSDEQGSALTEQQTEKRRRQATTNTAIPRQNTAGESTNANSQVDQHGELSDASDHDNAAPRKRHHHDDSEGGSDSDIDNDTAHDHITPREQSTDVEEDDDDKEATRVHTWMQYKAAHKQLFDSLDHDPASIIEALGGRLLPNWSTASIYDQNLHAAQVFHERVSVPERHRDADVLAVRMQLALEAQSNSSAETAGHYLPADHGRYNDRTTALEMSRCYPLRDPPNWYEHPQDPLRQSWPRNTEERPRHSDRQENAPWHSRYSIPADPHTETRHPHATASHYEAPHWVTTTIAEQTPWTSGKAQQARHVEHRLTTNELFVNADATPRHWTRQDNTPPIAQHTTQPPAEPSNRPPTGPRFKLRQLEYADTDRHATTRRAAQNRHTPVIATTESVPWRPQQPTSNATGNFDINTSVGPRFDLGWQHASPTTRPYTQFNAGTRTGGTWTATWPTTTTYTLGNNEQPQPTTTHGPSLHGQAERNTGDQRVGAHGWDDQRPSAQLAQPRRGECHRPFMSKTATTLYLSLLECGGSPLPMEQKDMTRRIQGIKDSPPALRLIPNSMTRNKLLACELLGSSKVTLYGIVDESGISERKSHHSREPDDMKHMFCTDPQGIPAHMFDTEHGINDEVITEIATSYFADSGQFSEIQGFDNTFIYCFLTTCSEAPLQCTPGNEGRVRFSTEAMQTMRQLQSKDDRETFLKRMAKKLTRCCASAVGRPLQNNAGAAQAAIFAAVSNALLHHAESGGVNEGARLASLLLRFQLLGSVPTGADPNCITAICQSMQQADGIEAKLTAATMSTTTTSSATPQATIWRGTPLSQQPEGNSTSNYRGNTPDAPANAPKTSRTRTIDDAGSPVRQLTKPYFRLYPNEKQIAGACRGHNQRHGVCTLFQDYLDETKEHWYVANGQVAYKCKDANEYNALKDGNRRGNNRRDSSHTRRNNNAGQPDRQLKPAATTKPAAEPAENKNE